MNKIFTLILGTILGASAVYFYFIRQEQPSEASVVKERKPLYWVAPMDANFRRNEPGLSPMGMELVPVYDDPGQEPGVIRIAPNVVQNLGVKTAEAESLPLVQQIKTVGKTRYNEDLVTHVHPRVSGWINKLYFKSAGLQVEKGAPLFTLYSLELVNAQEEYILALNSQRNNLINAAKSKLQALNLDNQTISRIAQNRKSEQYVTFFAPQNGIITHLNVSEGEFVEPKVEILALADLTTLWFEAELTEDQLSKVSLGDDLTMRFNALPTEKLFGEIDFIYPYLDETKNTAMARLTLDNQQQMLKPNMLADVVIKPAQQEKVLLVPRSAVIRLGNQDRVVWSQNPGEYKSVKIKLGQANDDFFEVVAGLEVGDQVVTSAQFLLDSESSKTSDLSRYELVEEPEIQSARTFGVIKGISAENITIARDAIDKWNRPPATLDFTIKQPHEEIAVGQKIDFTFEISNGEFVITEVHQILDEVNND